MKNKSLEPLKKFTIVQAVGTVVCVTICITICSLLTHTAVGFITASEISSGLLSCIFTLFHIFGYDEATLDLNSGSFKGSIDVHQKDASLVFTTVIPFNNGKEENE